MKSIPTLYEGVQYKSRLEARWKVLFNELNMDAVYEPFSFRSSINGGAYQVYTPDFITPLGHWVEVKGNPYQLRDQYDDYILEVFGSKIFEEDCEVVLDRLVFVGEFPDFGSLDENKTPAFPCLYGNEESGLKELMAVRLHCYEDKYWRFIPCGFFPEKYQDYPHLEVPWFVTVDGEQLEQLPTLRRAFRRASRTGFYD